jgi:hypothetical protein
LAWYTAYALEKSRMLVEMDRSRRGGTGPVSRLKMAGAVVADAAAAVEVCVARDPPSSATVIDEIVTVGLPTR